MHIHKSYAHLEYACSWFIIVYFQINQKDVNKFQMVSVKV